MCRKEVVIKNEVGLHSKFATFFTKRANEFRASIWLVRDDRRVNAKSLLGVLSIGVVAGDKVTIVADGNDGDKALAALVELIESGFKKQG